MKMETKQEQLDWIIERVAVKHSWTAIGKEDLPIIMAELAKRGIVIEVGPWSVRHYVISYVKTNPEEVEG